MRNGWYIRDGQKITQSMIFLSDHPEFPDMPKGMKQVLVERGINTSAHGLQAEM